MHHHDLKGALLRGNHLANRRLMPFTTVQVALLQRTGATQNMMLLAVLAGGHRVGVLALAHASVHFLINVMRS